MDKVQKIAITDYNAPSSESFRLQKIKSIKISNLIKYYWVDQMKEDLMVSREQVMCGTIRKQIISVYVKFTGALRTIDIFIIVFCYAMPNC
jgi:hypothetical protein